MSTIRLSTGTLASLVAQGWTLQPPAPDKAGPSNWVEINIQIAHMKVQEVVAMERQSDNFLGPDQDREPPELRNVHSHINDRFNTSPFFIGDAFNPPV